MKVKLKPEDVEAAIVEEMYHHFPGTTTTVCCLKMNNGCSVLGESHAADLAEFNLELGRKYAREKAFNNALAMETYLLKYLQISGRATYYDYKTLSV